MVRKKWDLPRRNEVVVGNVKKINPNSVFIRLVEYNNDGMVHVSEVSSGWVRDIRRHVKQGETLVLKVLDVDKDKGHVYLSIKRVSDYERKHKLDEWKRERKAENLLKLAAENLNKNLDQAYEEVGFRLQEEFGEMYVGFETSVKKPNLLEQRGIPKEWIDAMREIAEKELQEREVDIRGILSVRITKPNGIDIIKEVLADRKANISYLSAPKYSVSLKGTDAKKTQKELESEMKVIISDVQGHGGEASFELE